MSHSTRHSCRQPLQSQAMPESDPFLDRLSLAWTPNIDICESRVSVTLQVEVPGVAADDLKATFQDGVLRIQGHKREVIASPKLLCYYCLERRYGKFDRRVKIDVPVDPRRARALLENGILTIDLPKLQDRDRLFEIPIKKS